MLVLQFIPAFGRRQCHGLGTTGTRDKEVKWKRPKVAEELVVIFHVHGERQCHCALHQNDGEEHFAEELVRSFSLLAVLVVAANLLRRGAREDDTFLGHLPHRVATCGKHDWAVIRLSRRRIQRFGPCCASRALFARRLRPAFRTGRNWAVSSGGGGCWGGC